MRKNSFFIILLVATITVDVFSQRWQPAAQIDGASLNINVITLPDGTTLIPLRRMSPNQKDSNVLYSVQSLLTDRKPWPKQFTGLPKIKGVYDGNGNGHPELRFDLHSGRAMLAFDAFSPFERTEQIARDSGWWPISGQMVEYLGDIDGDELEDQWVSVKDEQRAIIVYGGIPTPYMHYSVVPANYQRDNEWRAQILAVGPLSGKMCMVQLAFKAEDYNSGFYQLLELNTEDLRTRRDTIRTTMLNKVANPGQYLFNSKILKADTVWHFFPGGLSTDVPSLKVTLKSSTIQPTKSVIRESDYTFWFGQGKDYGEWYYPVTMNAKRLIAVDRGVTPGANQRVVRLFKCTNANDAELTAFADAQLPITRDSSRNSVSVVVLIPDYDGDGIEDLVVGHGWTDPGNNVYRRAVSIFLTTQIQPVSVDDRDLDLEKLEASTILTARRLDNGWLVTQAGRCAQEELSPVYNVQGQKIAMIRTEISGDDVILYDDGAITERPTWCVVGTCVIRLY